jgi:hypothetical protein
MASQTITAIFQRGAIRAFLRLASPGDKHLAGPLEPAPSAQELGSAGVKGVRAPREPDRKGEETQEEG